MASKIPTATATTAAADEEKRLNALTKAYADLDLLRHTCYKSCHSRNCEKRLKEQRTPPPPPPSPPLTSFKVRKCEYCDPPHRNQICDRCGVCDKSDNMWVCRPCFYHKVLSKKFA